MNLNRLIAILIVLFIGLTAFGLSTDNTLLISLGHIFILPMVGIWYGFKRRWQTNPIDIAMYAAYFIGSFSDSTIAVREVNQTCERCSLFDCKERVAAPAILQKKRQLENMKAALKSMGA